MKRVSIRDFQRKTHAWLEAAQTDRVVITRHGRPTAVLVGVDGQDWESVVLESSQAFWDLIEARRRQPTVPLSELRDKEDEPSPKRCKHRRSG